MLNFDIKRKINSLRDILVGKVPDPKAQVEQITIALIYKFMDDMDLEGVKFGGNREFFKDEYEKYAWTNIMNNENSGQQRAILYAEGIEKMVLNPNLPQLFRDIFRGAYLPYRDAETLNMFLKEISDFQYDHSEELGNAFEYLLSIMGSQGDAGMFRTPRHIIDMIVEIVDPQKRDTILDPACGTAGFLISSYKHILKKNRDENGNSTLTSDDRKRFTNNFAGYDISPDMVRLSRVNMYLHKFSKPQISEYDTLSSLDKWNDSYDVILANPPFMTPKGGIIPHNRYMVQAKRSEVLFVDYIAEHLNPNGKAGIIVPEGIVFNTANAYKALRKFIVEDDLLYAVISLPAGVFQPYSGVKTSILLFDRKYAKQKDSILFVKMNNDGFDLGAQRREISQNDIPEVIRIIEDFKNGIDVLDNPLVTIATKEEIKEQDYILVGDRYKEVVVHNSDWPMVEVGNVINNVKYTEKLLKSEFKASGNYPVVDQSENYIAGYYDDESLLFRINKPVICFGDHTRAIKYIDFNFILGADGVKILEPIDSINTKYMYYCLRYMEIQSLGYSRHFKALKELKIPLPPLHIQEEIVKEIEGYQKIIDGARQVVENYKPIIKIDPEWEMVELGEICDVNKESINPSEKFGLDSFVYLDISSVENGTGKVSYDNYVVGNKAASRARRRVKNGDILLSTVRPNLKAFGYVDYANPENCVASTGFAVITTKGPNSKFIYYSVFQEYMMEQMISSMGKGAYPSINQKDVSSLKILLPSLDIQQQIVEEIDEEIYIVKQNERLLEIFNNKIKDKISKIWGSN